MIGQSLSKFVLVVFWKCVLSADLCGGRGSARLPCNPRIQSPSQAVGISAVSRAGRGCECCIGRFLEKGVAGIRSLCVLSLEEISTKMTRQHLLYPRSKQLQRFSNWQQLAKHLPFPALSGHLGSWRKAGRKQGPLNMAVVAD